jgi:hypothetical protein
MPEQPYDTHTAAAFVRGKFRENAVREGLDPERVWRETDASDRMDGRYIKVECDGETVGCLTWIRAGFLTSVIDSGSRWLNRPILPKRLATHIDLFAD